MPLAGLWWADDLTVFRAGAVELRRFEEGRCVQIKHVARFSAEGPAIAQLHADIAALDAKPVGKHHEIYLSDIRRTPPLKWKTILRQPLA